MLVRREMAPGVLGLTIDRPPVNALSPDLLDALGREFVAAPESGASAVVLAGRPGIFSAGLDVPVLLGLDQRAMLEFWRTFFELLAIIARSSIPVAVAITGHCPAGGTVIALFADYRVAADGEFKLGLNEVAVGLPMPALVYRAFLRLVGSRFAEQLCVGGQLVDPTVARTLGLVDAVVEPERTVDAAVQWARELLRLPRRAMAATRALAREDLMALFADLGDAEYEAMNATWFSADTQEALRAFVARLAERGSVRDHMTGSQPCPGAQKPG